MKDRVRSWAIRCMHEASLWEQNCFITLTYNDENLPEKMNLEYSHFQAFMKKLRHYVGIFDPYTKTQWDKTKVRFFVAGEYGDLNGRPHFHLLLFNYDFCDKILHSEKNGYKLYTSETLDWLWQKGHASIGVVQYESAAYVAQYCMKKIEDPRRLEHIDLETGEFTIRNPEFVKMSTRPGIGSAWYSKYKKDLFPHDRCIVNGSQVSVPKYYSKKLKAESPNDYEEIIIKRQDRAKERMADNTEERLLVKEKILKAKQKNKVRM